MLARIVLLEHYSDASGRIVPIDKSSSYSDIARAPQGYAILCPAVVSAVQHVSKDGGLCSQDVANECELSNTPRGVVVHAVKVFEHDIV